MNIKQLDLITRLAALAFLVSRVSGADALALNPAMKLVSWIRLGLAVYEKKWKEVAVLFALLPKFRLGLWGGREDADRVSFAEHVFRGVVFGGRMDLKLPPRMTVMGLAEFALTRGPWQRHLMEAEMTLQHGSTFCFYLPGSHTFNRASTLAVFVTHPDDVEQVLTDRESFPTRGYTGFNELVGEGLLGMYSGQQHSAHRAIVTKFLSDNHLRGFSIVVEDEIKVLLGKWGVDVTKPKKSKLPKSKVNVQYDLGLLTLDVIMRTGFGARKEHLSQQIEEADNHLAHGLDEALKSIIIRTVVPGWEHLPIPLERRVNHFMTDSRSQMKEIFDQAITRISQQEACGEKAEATMLSAMLDMRRNKDKDAAGLTDKEIFDELLTIRGAGHETTSNTLSWAMLLLYQHPVELAFLREETDRVIKGDVCTYDESKEMKRHIAVIYETLRLYPTVPSFPRECHSDTVIKRTGFDIPKGSLVLVSQRPLNRNPEFWPRPDDFMPSRFGEEPTTLKMGVPIGVPNGPKYGFAPFGAANRSCVGQRMALLEAVQILSTVVKNCDWRLSNPSSKVAEVAEVTLGPKKGLYMEISPRVAL